LNHFDDLAGKGRVLGNEVGELGLAQFDGDPEEEGKLIRKGFSGLL
jgi:hypothetical protein